MRAGPASTPPSAMGRASTVGTTNGRAHVAVSARQIRPISSTVRAYSAFAATPAGPVS